MPDLRHIAISFCPFRIAQGHVMRAQARRRNPVTPGVGRRVCALPGQDQIAIDRKTPTGRFTDTFIEPGLGAVPVEHQKEEYTEQ
ncbi:hypothetical protein D3C73_1452820 [compost metagenome]